MSELPTIKLKGFKHHPAADIFPMLAEDSVGFKATFEDIKANGMHTAVWMCNGEVLEGRHRVRILEMLGKEELSPYTHYRNYEGNDPYGFVLSMNLHRRHLNASQRAMVAAKLANLGVGTNQSTKGSGPSIEEAAKLLNVGHASVERAKIVLAKGDPSLIAAVEQGDVAVSPAAAEVKQQEVSSSNSPAKTTRKRRKNSGGSGVQDDPPDHSMKKYKAFLGAVLDALAKWPKDAETAGDWRDYALEKLKEVMTETWSEPDVGEGDDEAGDEQPAAQLQ